MSIYKFILIQIINQNLGMCVLGMHEELREYKIGVNALWPRTAIATAAVNNALGGDTMMK